MWDKRDDTLSSLTKELADLKIDCQNFEREISTLREDLDKKEDLRDKWFKSARGCSISLEEERAAHANTKRSYEQQLNALKTGNYKPQSKLLLKIYEFIMTLDGTKK